MKQEILSLKNFINKAIWDAERLQSNIRVERLIKMKGFSSPRIRHLLNNLCSLTDTTYLDIGCYRGLSLCSALWGNKAKGYAVDTFTYDYLASKPISKDHIPATIRALRDFTIMFKCKDQVSIMQKDICKLDIKEFKSLINVCYYDAGLQVGQSYNTMNNIIPALSRFAIVVNSSMQNPEISEGIEKAFNDNKVGICYKIQLRSKTLEDIYTWWNGVNIWLIEKQLSDKDIKKEKEHKHKLAINKVNQLTKQKEKE